MTEHQLEGGIANAGQVVRSGSHVLRPASPHTTAIHSFLRALRHAGFTGAPLPIGTEPDGRERLEFIHGDVPSVPYPAWSQTDTALASLGRLLRDFHDAASTFTSSHDLSWNDALADPAGGNVVCHNDLELSNIVFRNGVAVAFIDLEFAAPGRPVYDLAHLARFCVPLDHDIVVRTRVGWQPTDQPRRLRLLADAYALDDNRRLELLNAIDDAMHVIEAATRRSIAAGDPNATALWNRTGGAEASTAGDAGGPNTVTSSPQHSADITARSTGPRRRHRGLTPNTRRSDCHPRPVPQRRPHPTGVFGLVNGRNVS